mmetsp:Transcript_8919/g.13145  ORF Transcript_8919/g.13145 Transcript_8919/m.13145 type:complete len:264 (-) Transcript_8919:1505-2296(-)
MYTTAICQNFEEAIVCDHIGLHGGITSTILFNSASQERIRLRTSLWITAARPRLDHSGIRYNIRLDHITNIQLIEKGLRCLWRIDTAGARPRKQDLVATTHRGPHSTISVLISLHHFMKPSLRPLGAIWSMCITSSPCINQRIIRLRYWSNTTILFLFFEYLFSLQCSIAMLALGVGIDETAVAQCIGSCFGVLARGVQMLHLPQYRLCSAYIIPMFRPYVHHSVVGSSGWFYFAIRKFHLFQECLRSLCWSRRHTACACAVC